MYPGNACTQRGQRISNWRNERSRNKINSTNDSWPISTPTLNITSAKGISGDRQAKRAQSAGKAEPVQQSKGEGDDPWMQDGNARLAPPGTDDLDTENQDRECDRGIEQRPWQMRITERRQPKGDAVGHRERRNGL